MRPFHYMEVRTVEEACSALNKYNGKARLNAGGTDLLSLLKGDLLPDYPEWVINIKTISGLNGIQEEDHVLKIGALTRLCDLVNSPLLRERYEILVESARSVASPQIRNVATVGGNLCQEVRCWYYRYPRSIGGPMHCLRKGSGPCLALTGDNRYHAILGGMKCFAVCPSDIAVALSVLDAKIVIAGLKGERRMDVVDFYHPLGNSLNKGEMVKGVEIPRMKEPSSQKFIKFTLRKPMDFAIVSIASILTLKNGICQDARMALGAVAPMPFRMKDAEKILLGKSLNKEVATQVAMKALEGAKPLHMNGYKVAIARTLIERAIVMSS